MVELEWQTCGKGDEPYGVQVICFGELKDVDILKLDKTHFK
jgi:hypothetical protein